MSTRLLEDFGEVRRRLNVLAGQMVAPLGIGTKQFLLVRQIGKLGSVTASELARLTLSDGAAVTRAVDALVQHGWVARKPHPTDRRQRQIELTAEGRRRVTRINRVYDRLADRFEAALSPKEREAFGQLLRTIARSLEEPIDEQR